MDRINRLVLLLGDGPGERAELLLEALGAHVLEASQERLVDNWIVDLELERRRPTSDPGELQDLRDQLHSSIRLKHLYLKKLENAGS